MKEQKIDVKFYGSDQNSELFSFDKETFDLITGANAELAKMVTDKDHRIAVLERALELAVKDKLFYEKELLRLVIGVKTGTYEDNLEIPCPRTEIYYKEQAEKELDDK